MCSFITNLPWNQILKIFTTIVEMLTIYSIFHGIRIYNETKKREKENNKIVLGNTKNELDINLEIVEYIEDRIKYKSKNLFAERFSDYFLEKSLIIITCLKTRTLLLNTISNMKTMNSFLNTYENSLLQNKRLAKESFEELEKKCKLIKTNLRLVRDSF